MVLLCGGVRLATSDARNVEPPLRKNFTDVGRPKVFTKKEFPHVADRDSFTPTQNEEEFGDPRAQSRQQVLV